jgi:hypothetical protein
MINGEFILIYVNTVKLTTLLRNFHPNSNLGTDFSNLDDKISNLALIISNLAVHFSN